MRGASQPSENKSAFSHMRVQTLTHVSCSCEQLDNHSPYLHRACLVSKMYRPKRIKLRVTEVINMLCAMAIHDTLTTTVFNKRFEMQLFGLALYIVFCWACFRIPDSVMYGEPLCFAYVYLMIQMMQVAMCHEASRVIVFLAAYAVVAPTSQILQGLENSYSREMDDIYTQFYMVKELVFYMALRHKRKKLKLDLASRDFVVCTLTVMFIVMDLIFFTYDFNTTYKTTGSKICFISRFTPTLVIGIMNM